MAEFMTVGNRTLYRHKTMNFRILDGRLQQEHLDVYVQPGLADSETANWFDVERVRTCRACDGEGTDNDLSECGFCDGTGVRPDYD